MKEWTNEPPKEVGFYWFRYSPEDELPEIVEVIERIHGGFVVRFFDGAKIDFENISPSRQFAGPIPEPGEEKE